MVLLLDDQTLGHFHAMQTHLGSTHPLLCGLVRVAFDRLLEQLHCVEEVNYQIHYKYVDIRLMIPVVRVSA